MRHHTERRRARRALRAVLTLAAVAIVAVFWPVRFGGATTILLVEGTSMEPTFSNGDLVVARRQASYAPGDIVVFGLRATVGGGHKVVHRIVAVEPDGRVVTRGDNRASPDAFPLTRDDIVGRALFRVPHGGHALFLMSRWWALALLSGTYVMVRSWPRRRDRSEHDEVAAPEWLPV